MQHSKIRAVGGSLMIAIPKPILNMTSLTEGADVAIAVEDGSIVLRPVSKRLGLKARLAMCDLKAKPSKAEREWLDMPAIGREDID